MDKLTTDFLSFFIPYTIAVLAVSLPLAVAIAKDGIIWLRDHHRKVEGMLMGELREARSARRKAEREAEFQLTTKTAEIERLAKKVATLEEELSALRANSSKQK